MLKKTQLNEQDRKQIELYMADCRYLENWAKKTLKKKVVDANDLLRLSGGAETCMKTIENTQAFNELVVTEGE